MPVDWSKYPENWKEIAFAVKDAAGRTLWESANVDEAGNRSGAVSHRNLIDALSRPVVFVDFAAMVERSASAARSALALASFDQTVSKMQYSRLCMRALQKWPGALQKWPGVSKDSR